MKDINNIKEFDLDNKFYDVELEYVYIDKEDYINLENSLKEISFRILDN